MNDGLQEAGFSPAAQTMAEYFVARARLAESQQPEFAYVVARLIDAVRDGATCIRVDEPARQLLAASGLSDTGLQPAPFVLRDNRLYLYRYWCYEQQIASSLARRCANEADYDARSLEMVMAELFAGQRDSAAQPDSQEQAVRQTLNQYFSIISGGPGTGKTTTVLKLLAALIYCRGHSHQPAIAMAAPTGKAASRLQQSLIAGMATMPASLAWVSERLPVQAATLHSLLKPRALSPYFQHNAENPLPYEAVVVDEASMIDVALMSKLLEALRPRARLILIGDANQLASVETGAVFASLIRALPAHTAMLTRSHRFNAAIRELAEAANQGDYAGLRQAADRFPEVVDISALQPSLLAAIARRYLVFVRRCQQGAAEDALACLHDYQVLCANNQGRFGVEGVNQYVENRVRQALGVETQQWYAGRPVLITENAVQGQLTLSNGDVGICLQDPHSNTLKVYFYNGQGGVSACSVARLPACQSAFALSIHKSQGSEFAHVVMLLPEQDNPVLTRALLYTGITRAREKVTIAGSGEVLRCALERCSTATALPAGISLSP